MDFPCVQCSLCCRALQHVSELASYHSGDGVCRYLDDRLCTIYEQRPVICNVQQMYHLYFQDHMTEPQFIRENLKACLQLAENEKDITAQIRLRQILDIYFLQKK